jgi:hypothetical protein
VTENASVEDHVRQLRQQGFAWVRGSLPDPEQALEAARALIDARSSATLRLLGDFILPPADGVPSRDFQTLHFDFGVPLDPKCEHDVGRYTALHIAEGFGSVSAVTRLVPLAAMLRQRKWPSQPELLARLVAYGTTHGAWDDDDGYVEGSLARIVEAAVGVPVLPSVKLEAGFLCGMEFDDLDSELRFFERHSVPTDEVVVEIPLSPGELLVFDNLAVAHGRRGMRQPGELHQWVFGESDLTVARQRELRDEVLAAFRTPSRSYAATASVLYAATKWPSRSSMPECRTALDVNATPRTVEPRRDGIDITRA